MVNIFQYLEKTKGKKIPLEYKLLNNIPLTKDELTIDGDLNLTYSNITTLPNNLTVNGDMSLWYSKIKSLPNNLTVKGFLSIYGTNISELPKDLYVGTELFCRCTPFVERYKNETSFFKNWKALSKIWFYSKYRLVFIETNLLEFIIFEFVRTIRKIIKK